MSDLTGEVGAHTFRGAVGKGFRQGPPQPCWKTHHACCQATSCHVMSCHVMKYHAAMLGTSPTPSGVLACRRTKNEVTRRKSNQTAVINTKESLIDPTIYCSSCHFASKSVSPASFVESWVLGKLNAVIVLLKTNFCAHMHVNIYFPKRQCRLTRYSPNFMSFSSWSGGVFDYGTQKRLGHHAFAALHEHAP